MLHEIKAKKSQNYDERQGVRPSLIILHYTGMETAQAALARLCDPEAKVSAHYLIDEDGQGYQLVDDDKRAWHAGVSYWNGIEDVNAHSIGIELVNPGHEFGYRVFPEAQINVLMELCQGLMAEYGIPSKSVLGHSDIAPARKQDPGEMFPWATLSQNNIGLWPRPVDIDYEAAADIVGDQAAIKELLGAYGYNVANEGFGDIVTAFHRHFYPEKFEPNQRSDEIDKHSIAKLLSLLRLAHNS